MDLGIYTDGKAYYTCPADSPVALRWYREGERWACSREEAPAGLRAAAFDELPSDLQEEVLALAARAGAVGSQLWSSGVRGGRRGLCCWWR